MLAVVRLLAGVCAGVYCQGAPLDEALATFGVVALVRPLVCVYPIMSLQIRLAVEALVMGELICRRHRCESTHLATCFPITQKGASLVGFVVDNLHDLHLWRLLGILLPWV
jgi:hypothetical protein